jgi:hypothetical protein
MASGEEPSLHSVLKMPVNSLEILELVNCHHEGLASLQNLGFGSAYTVLYLLFAVKSVTLTRQKQQIFLVDPILS